MQCFALNWKMDMLLQPISLVRCGCIILKYYPEIKLKLKCHLAIKQKAELHSGIKIKENYYNED